MVDTQQQQHLLSWPIGFSLNELDDNFTPVAMATAAPGGMAYDASNSAAGYTSTQDYNMEMPRESFYAMLTHAYL